MAIATGRLPVVTRVLSGNRDTSANTRASLNPSSTRLLWGSKTWITHPQSTIIIKPSCHTLVAKYQLQQSYGSIPLSKQTWYGHIQTSIVKGTLKKSMKLWNWTKNFHKLRKKGNNCRIECTWILASWVATRTSFLPSPLRSATKGGGRRSASYLIGYSSVRCIHASLNETPPSCWSQVSNWIRIEKPETQFDNNRINSRELMRSTY